MDSSDIDLIEYIVHQAHISQPLNEISIGLAVFAQLIHVPNTQTQRLTETQTDRPRYVRNLSQLKKYFSIKNYILIYHRQSTSLRLQRKHLMPTTKKTNAKELKSHGMHANKISEKHISSNTN